MSYFFSQSQNEPISRFWFPSLLLHHLVWLKCSTATLKVDLAFNPISTINTCCTAQANYLTSLGPRSLFCKNEKILSVLTHRDFPWELSESVKKKSLWSMKKIKIVSFSFCWAPSTITATPDTPSDSSQSSELCFLQSHLGFCVDRDCLMVGNAWKWSYHSREKKRSIGKGRKVSSLDKQFIQLVATHIIPNDSESKFRYPFIQKRI